MKTLSGKTRIFVVFVICLLVGLSVFWFTDGLCTKVLLPRINWGLPDYISNVWPPPVGDVWSVCYNQSLLLPPFNEDYRGINLKLDTYMLFQLLSSKTKNVLKKPFPEWVSLYVDGTQIPDTLMRYQCTCTPRLLELNGKPYPVNLEITNGLETFNWSPPLAIGYHTAKLVVAVPDVEPLEYEWHFFIK